MKSPYGDGWLITANVIVDAERGYFTFGISGPLLVTVATGLTLRWVLAVGRDRESAGTPRSRPVAAARR
jgi:hypothetical protein